ncbi:hypothetical protein A2U01_0107370, partial [Trifolium medium]|nr:hypothetical protein [Trifolium medium]
SSARGAATPSARRSLQNKKQDNNHNAARGAATRKLRTTKTTALRAAQLHPVHGADA